MKLSVIIPVFNSAGTLDRCIASVLAQNIEGMEIILVDDGSTDDSPAICDRWQLGNENIVVIHKKNGGLSDARNAGMDIVTGERVTFIDSDDEVEKHTYYDLMHYMDNHPDCDIVEYPVKIHVGGPDERDLYFVEKQWKSAKEYWEQCEVWEHCYVCNKMYKKSVIDGIKFPMRNFEDLWWYAEVLRQKNPMVSTVPYGLYRYYSNPYGICYRSEKSVPMLIQLLESQIHAAWVIRTLPFSGKCRKMYRSMFCRVYDIIRLNICRLSKNFQK